MGGTLSWGKRDRGREGGEKNALQFVFPMGVVGKKSEHLKSTILRGGRNIKDHSPASRREEGLSRQLSEKKKKRNGGKERSKRQERNTKIRKKARKWRGENIRTWEIQ